MKNFTESDLTAYLEGRMASDTTRELEEALRQDPTLRKELLVQSGFEAELPLALRPEGTALAPCQVAKAPSKLRFIHVLIPLGIAAGLIITVRALMPQGQPITPRGAPSPLAVQTPPPPPPPALPVEGRLVEIHGEVTVTELHSQPLLVRTQGGEIHAGATVAFGSNADVRVVSIDGSEYRLYKKTIAVLDRTRTGPLVDIIQGAVDAVVKPQTNGQHLIINTRTLSATVIGTELRVMTDSTSAWVGVRKGSVQTTRKTDGQRVMLATGNYAADAPQWPFMRMNARVCPYWKAVCKEAVGTPYP